MFVPRRLPLRSALASLLLVSGLALNGCQTQKDAVAAAQQMAATAITLQAYYGSLIGMVEGTQEAQTAQNLLNKTPADNDLRAQLDDEKAELRKRAAMAHDLGRLAALFADITNSGAAADASKAAADLGTELTTMKAFSSDADAEALKLSVTAIVNMIKAHDEVKAAKLIRPVASSIADFFDKESSTYISFANSYYITAAANSRELVSRDQVSNSFLYRSSLRPFGLTAEITDTDLRKTAKDELKIRVADRLTARQAQNKVAATDLSESLHVMRDRIANVAEGKPLRATLPPLTLDGVKGWITDVKTDIGE